MTMSTPLESSIKLNKMLMRLMMQKASLLQQAQEHAAANQKKLRIQGKMLARLRENNDSLTQDSADARRRLKIRRRQADDYKAAVEDLQRQLERQKKENKLLLASIAESERVISRLNRTIEAANVRAGHADTEVEPLATSQHARFMAAMRENTGPVREVQGGFAGALA